MDKRMQVWRFAFQSISAKRAIFIALSIFAIASVDGPTHQMLGVELSETGGTYEFSAGASPIWFAFSALFVVGFIWNLRSPPLSTGEVPASITRRVIAWWLDILWVMMILTPLAGLPALLVESHATGEFAWAVHRNFRRVSDIYVAAPIVILGFGLIFLYFLVSTYKANRTPGNVVMGIQIEFAGKRPTIAQITNRIFAGFVTLFGALLYFPQAARDPRKQLWHDKVSRSRVLKTEL